MSKAIPITAINEDRFDAIQPIKQDVVDAMVPSVQKLGIILPLVVVGPNSRTKKYDLLDGRHRLAAAKAAGLTYVPVVVRKTLVKDATITQVVANLIRTSLTELEEGRAYKVMVEQQGMTMTEIGALVKKTKAHVSQRIALTKLPEEVQGALESEDINFSDARRIGSLPKGEQVAALADAIESTPESTTTEEPASPPSSKELLGSPQRPAKPTTPKAKPKTKAQQKRERSKAVKQSVASRKGQRPGAATKGMSLQERYDAAKPGLIQAFSDSRDGISKAQEKLAGELLDYLMAEKLLLVRAS